MNVIEKVVLFIILILAAMFCEQVHADEWTTADTYREATYQTLQAIDWGQTRNIAEHQSTWYEQNNYLGTHPEMGAVNRYFIAGAALHAAISYVLPESMRAPFQYATIGIEAGCVAHNYSLRIGVRF